MASSDLTDAATVASSLDRPDLYINRELSWLAFNARVLAQARDSRHPLLERVKFLAIVGTNLDEFFMIRVATLQKQLRMRFETRRTTRNPSPHTSLTTFGAKSHPC